MRGKFVQIAVLCLVLALLTGLAGEPAQAAAPAAQGQGELIRVGLHYGTGAMEGLNLENSVGSGYRFGYYDSGSQFVALGSTPQKAISVVETMNVYYGAYDGYTSYHTAPISSVAVGEYHLQLPGSYATFADAQAAASYYGGFPACIGGVFYARVGSYTTRDGALAGQASLAAQGVAAELCGTSAYGVSVVITGTSTILFQYDDLGQGTGLGVLPGAAETGEKCVTLSKGFRYYGGFRFERIKGGALTVVNILGMEDYLKGVVSIEMSDSWPMEALKAQAVAARSYAVALRNTHSAHHFDLCYDTHCQAYCGLNLAGANCDAAVDQTAGQVALWEGQAACTYYHASNGGASESISVVWGSNQAKYPYLVGVADPYETYDSSWTRSFTGAVLASKLQARGYGVSGTITAIEVTALTEAGNPRLVTFTDSAGKRFPVSTSELVGKLLFLPSYRYGFDSAAVAPQPAPSSGGLSINGTTVDGAAGLYAIDGNGNLSPVGGDAYIITESGVSQLSQAGSGGGTGGGGGLSATTGSNGTFTFVGRGSGHNIGMSQRGAQAMAQQGYTYVEILQFYYTGITVGYT